MNWSIFHLFLGVCIWWWAIPVWNIDLLWLKQWPRLNPAGSSRLQIIKKSATNNLWIVAYLLMCGTKFCPKIHGELRKMYLTFGPEMALNHRKLLTALWTEAKYWNSTTNNLFILYCTISMNLTCHISQAQVLCQKLVNITGHEAQLWVPNLLGNHLFTMRLLFVVSISVYIEVSPKRKFWSLHNRFAS